MYFTALMSFRTIYGIILNFQLKILSSSHFVSWAIANTIFFDQALNKWKIGFINSEFADATYIFPLKDHSS